jgi:acetoin utilization protein AcuB
MNYLLSRLKVEELMTEDVVTVMSDTPIEDAAHLMVVNRIGGMPVVDADGRAVGIITETDIFKAFVELLGGGQPGLRLSLEVPTASGTLAKLSQTIFELGGNIISLGTLSQEDDGPGHMIVKVQDVAKAHIVESLEALGDHVLDARDV